MTMTITIMLTIQLWAG